MHPVLIFLFALISILLLTAKFRLHPFLSLVLVSFFIGVLAGEPMGAVEAVTEGLGNVFSRFAIIITSGSIIGLLLQKTGGMSLIASDIMRFSRNPLLALNFLGFLFSVPMMCYILAYVIFIPIAKELATKLNYPPISTATALALGAVASFNLVYPSPVIISAAEELSANTDTLILLGFFIAIPTSTAGYLYARRLGKTENSRVSENENQVQAHPGSTEITEDPQKKEAGIVQEKGIEVQGKDGVQRKDTGKPGRFETYAPIFLPLLLILFQAGFENPNPLFAFLGNPNVALLIGVLLAIFSSRALEFEMVRTLVEKAVRRSGVVLLDLCGGGALGATLAMTGAGEALGRFFLQINLPHILVPFLVAVALQTVQGSRVVTMLVAPSLLLPMVPELGLPAEILILAMASGTFMISHVNDPFFWIFGELAELDPSEVFRANTLGGALMGVISFLLVSGVYIFFY
ncbi:MULTISPECIES: GntP family permease [unclassified Methanosarcina]|uniref:GntP family permease n=1 Tax=unclassified Methanosarcina TaxID=2644672 RepID=UPI000616184D|nr:MULTISPECIES: GntP family permease [unclassified Methanosarcina]AKB20254.1 putative permease [Methanosarcina sp. WWM596]AKB23453.1 putative permease [Methanosarcina sp. WH1]